jgi:hypothetical protein
MKKTLHFTAWQFIIASVTFSAYGQQPAVNTLAKGAPQLIYNAENYQFSYINEFSMQNLTEDEPNQVYYYPSLVNMQGDATFSVASQNHGDLNIRTLGGTGTLSDDLIVYLGMQLSNPNSFNLFTMFQAGDANTGQPLVGRITNAVPEEIIVSSGIIFHPSYQSPVSLSAGLKYINSAVVDGSWNNSVLNTSTAYAVDLSASLNSLNDNSEGNTYAVRWSNIPLGNFLSELRYSPNNVRYLPSYIAVNFTRKVVFGSEDDYHQLQVTADFGKEMFPTLPAPGTLDRTKYNKKGVYTALFQPNSNWGESANLQYSKSLDYRSDALFYLGYTQGSYFSGFVLGGGFVLNKTHISLMRMFGTGDMTKGYSISISQSLNSIF